jgi:MoxR-like ATPase
VIEVPAGGLPLSERPSQLVPIAEQVDLLTRMLVSHSRGDMCLVGPSGVGKSAVVREFARVLGYSVQPVLLHKDMTSRDLLQVRVSQRLHHLASFVCEIYSKHILFLHVFLFCHFGS